MYRILKKKVEFLLFSLFFILFIPSFYNNTWNIGNLNAAYFESEGDISEFEGYDPYPNMLIVGRMNESKMNGVFSKAGLPGINYDRKSVPDSIIDNQYMEQPRYIILYHNIINEYRNFLQDKKSPDNYCPYISQIGGQGILYSSINNILPFRNAVNYKIIKLFNAILTSLCFVLFLGWCYRNFNITATIITFILILISPWITLMGTALWWSVWGLYIPFLASLLIFEKRSNHPEAVSDKFVLTVIFAAVLAKCIFTGYEFVTSCLMAIYTPVIYYAWLNKEKYSAVIVLSFKIGISALCAAATSLLILLLQIQSVMGGYKPALEYITTSYERRTHFQTGNIPDNIFEIVIKRYLKEDAFFFGFLDKPSPVNYLMLVCLILAICGILFYLAKGHIKYRKYSSLAITSIFSLLCPLSWYYIFIQHAHQHPFYDTIVWYIVFLLWGYLIIGVGISLLIKQIKVRLISKNKNNTTL